MKIANRSPFLTEDLRKLVAVSTGVIRKAFRAMGLWNSDEFRSWPEELSFFKSRDELQPPAYPVRDGQRASVYLIDPSRLSAMETVVLALGKNSNRPIISPKITRLIVVAICDAIAGWTAGGKHIWQPYLPEEDALPVVRFTLKGRGRRKG